MSAPPKTPGGDARPLLDRLREVRASSADLPQDELQARLMRTLRDELAKVEAGTASRMLAEAREALAGEARGREQRLASLQGELNVLREELRSVASERDGLRARVGNLEAQLSTMIKDRDRLAASAERAALSEQALSREKQRGDQLEAALRQHTELRESESESRRALEADNASLRAELEEARRRIASAPAPAPPSPPPSSPDASRPESLNTLREALRSIAVSDHVDVDDEAPLDSESRVLRLSQELLKFALDYERGIQAFLMGLAIEHQLDTQQIERQSAAVRQRFLDCLDNREGSLQRLRETLDRNRRFILDLNEAYTRAIPSGVREVLGELEPGSILASARGAFGMKDHAEAWRSISEKHAQLKETPADELLTRYFVPTIQRELDERRV